MATPQDNWYVTERGTVLHLEHAPRPKALVARCNPGKRLSKAQTARVLRERPKDVTRCSECTRRFVVA